MDAAAHRRYYADLVVPTKAAQRERLVAAYAAVPREHYVGHGPWRVYAGDGRYVTTPSDDLAFLYQDQVVALDEERGINNGSPSSHAMWLATLAPRDGESVVHVGAGTGYYTAILAELVGPRGTVLGFEVAADLAGRAVANLLRRANVRIAPESAFAAVVPSCDVLYVNAAVTDLPERWLDALSPGARLLAPLTPRDAFGGMLLVTRRASADGYDARFVSGAMFVASVGGVQDDASARLAAAFKAGGHGAVRSLRRGTAQDATCWYAAPRWWLSTQP